MDVISKEKLRRNHEVLVNSIDVNQSAVLDSLIEDGVISSAEEEEIRASGTKRDQNSHLLSILKKRGTSMAPFEKFIRALRIDYDFIAESLVNTHVPIDNTETTLLCIHCTLLRCLEPRDVSHFLYQERLLKSEDDLAMVNSNQTPRHERVKQLLDILSSDNAEVISILSNSLKKKYDFIEVQAVGNVDDLRHCCCTKRSWQTTEYNVKRRIRRKSVRDRMKSQSRHKKSCGQINWVANTVPETERISNLMPVSALDTKLLRKCSTLWNHLFVLRERGEWETVDRLTSQARVKYAHCPDIQVLLYGSEMCISIFYKSNHEQALKAFEMAMKEVPQTSMSSWHITRILPLNVELLSRLQKFEEAERYVSDSHQAMSSLEPCLSTGAVHFFEALYLSAILRCNRSGTQSQQLFDRVKECFITAIHHYQQEKIFAIKSFLNQVYIFLALFALGIDFRKIAYINMNKVSDDAADLTHHYLSLFENTCWEEATTWSKMLFFIGRAEQHKLLNNFERSRSYWRDAECMAQVGCFEEHTLFIKTNFDYVSEMYENRLCAKQFFTKDVTDILEELSDESRDEI